MLAFTGLSQIEQYAETPANKVRGPFSCLLQDYYSSAAGPIMWQMLYPDDGAHPYATARSKRPMCPRECDPFMVEAAAAVWGSRSATEAAHVFRCAAIPITEAEVRAGQVLANYYASVRDNDRRCAGLPA